MWISGDKGIFFDRLRNLSVSDQDVNDFVQNNLGGDDPTLWTLRHVPAPVWLRATLTLGGATVSPCETRLVPQA